MVIAATTKVVKQHALSALSTGPKVVTLLTIRLAGTVTLVHASMRMPLLITQFRKVPTVVANKLRHRKVGTSMIMMYADVLVKPLQQHFQMLGILIIP